MEEMAKEEEEEERKARIESALDVRKQNDLSGFYRHLYRYRSVNEYLSGSFGFFLGDFRGSQGV